MFIEKNNGFLYFFIYNKLGIENNKNINNFINIIKNN